MAVRVRSATWVGRASPEGFPAAAPKAHSATKIPVVQRTRTCKLSWRMAFSVDSVPRSRPIHLVDCNDCNSKGPDPKIHLWPMETTLQASDLGYKH